MSNFRRLTPTALLMLGLLLPVGPVALAQTAPSQAAPSQATPGQTGAPPDITPEEAEHYPVFAITGVEILRSQIKPELDVVVARGLTSAGGWTNGELIPLTNGATPDHVLDLVFIADAPQESSAPSGYAPIHAVLPLAPGHPFTAVRVRSATNSVLLKDLTGAVEATAPIAPCNHCVGRYFVATGSAAPSGVAANQILRQEDLPPHARIILPSDGITDVRRNPDRLTILIGDDGRVVDAVWE
jgi:hypothetical protein